LLSKYHPNIFLATHGNRVHAKCISLLKSLEYNFIEISKNRYDEPNEILARPKTGCKNDTRLADQTSNARSTGDRQTSPAAGVDC
jgi:hypothetical protein